MISKDSAEALRTVIEQTFSIIEPHQMVISCVRYSPQNRNKYKDLNEYDFVENEFLVPFVFSSQEDIGQLPTLLEERAMLLDKTEELAVGLTYFVMPKKSQVYTNRLPIYDGAPGKKNVTNRLLTYFDILETQNGLHYYSKGSRQFSRNDKQIDPRWFEMFEKENGFIRVSENVKGQIRKITAPSH